MRCSNFGKSSSPARPGSLPTVLRKATQPAMSRGTFTWQLWKHSHLRTGLSRKAFASTSSCSKHRCEGTAPFERLAHFVQMLGHFCGGLPLFQYSSLVSFQCRSPLLKHTGPFRVVCLPLLFCSVALLPVERFAPLCSFALRIQLSFEGCSFLSHALVPFERFDTVCFLFSNMFVPFERFAS